MPHFTVTDTFSDPVSVEAGDVIQNTGPHMILVCPSSTPTDGNSVEILPNKGITIDAAESVCVRARNSLGGSFKLIRGL